MADIVKGDEEWMVIDKEGKQPMLGQRYKPEELRLKLTSGKSKQWESVFKAVIKPECGGLCVLECKRCKEDVSPNNPSQAATRHKCKPAALAAAGVRSSPRKRDYNADSAKLQIIVSPKPDFLRNFWLTKANKLFPLLAVAANKLLSAHATSCAAERNWSAWGRIYTSLRNKLDLETAEKLVYVKANMPEEWYS